jgi:2-phosphoglycerate kinase
MVQSELKTSEAQEHTVYLVGGPARTGKTTILEAVLYKRTMMAVSSDAIRSAIRNALIDEPYVSVDNLDFSGNATFRRPGSLAPHTKIFSKNIQDEEELAWAGVVGLIDHYSRRNDTDLIIEGIAITPERVNKLKTDRLVVKAAFVGFTDNVHVDSILAHAQNHKSDWVNKWLKEHNNDDTHIRNWGERQIEISKKFQAQASRHGFGFFDIVDRPFSNHVEAVTDYLLR